MSATPEYVLVPRVPTEEMIDAACESEARAVVIARNRAKWPKLNDQCSHGEIFVVEYQAALAAAPAHPPAALPVRDREADRNRFPDAAFNRWLDEGISDAGHTVWDQIADVCTAWHGWVNRPFYEPTSPALPDGWLAEADRLVGDLLRAAYIAAVEEEDIDGTVDVETKALNALMAHLKRAVP